MTSKDTALPVFIIHWNAPEPCVSSIAGFQAQDVPTDITVVDNGSRTDALGRLESETAAAGVGLMHLGRNTGYAGAANTALTRWLEDDARGDWAVIAAHDALPAAGCLRRLLAAVSVRAHAGIACAEYGVGHRPRLSALRGPVLVDGVRGVGWEDVLWPHGTLMLVRRQCLEDVGLFDPGYFAYGEEQDLGLRARAGGWGVGVVWDARVDNPQRTPDVPTTSYLQIRNSVRLVEAHLGKTAAVARSLTVLANTALLLVWRSRRPSAHDSGARVRAVLDFWRGVDGPPPERGSQIP